ncbi:MAG TPA: twin-arginine translocase subunit TatC [Nitrososphaerales archaeon]|nr:twin-arginine translocase subunit TatC [Nitrososphaerales archaeon]
MSSSFKIGEHLTELRHRLKVVFISLVVIIIVVFLLPLNPSQLLSLNAVYYTTPVSVFLHYVVSYTLPSGWELIPFTVSAPLEILLIAAAVMGLAIDMPIITYEVYKFVDPALKPEERRMTYPVIASTTVLFIVGLAFGYFLLAKFVFIAMAPFYSAVGITPPYLIQAVDFYTIVFLSVVFSGIAFTTPVFVYLLIRFGILPADLFTKNRLWIWVITYIVTALVTPDGGPVLDVILFVPVIFLLEIGVFLGGRSVRRANGPASSETKGGVVCPFCGEILEKPALFCPRCGRSIA